MDRVTLGTAGHGALRLPPGFRFLPTDEDLVVQYLKRKVFSCPLPASVILEIDLGKYDPWSLPGSCEGVRYFFTRREAKRPGGKRLNRAGSSGYWKATGKEKPVRASRCNDQVVGMKKVLVFYRGKPRSGCRTDWIMHEYRLADADGRTLVFPQRKNTIHGGMIPSQDWVVCRIFKERKATKMVDEIEQDQEAKIKNGGMEERNQVKTMEVMATMEIMQSKFKKGKVLL